MGDSRIKNQESRIKNQESRIKNQESRIKNQESRIKRRGGRKKRRMRRLFSVARVSRALHFFNVRLTKDSAPRGRVALPFFKDWD
jgi:hypothetical protein